jgi:hypothetical protein
MTKEWNCPIIKEKVMLNVTLRKVQDVQHNSKLDGHKIHATVYNESDDCVCPKSGEMGSGLYNLIF